MYSLTFQYPLDGTKKGRKREKGKGLLENILVEDYLDLKDSITIVYTFSIAVYMFH